MGTRRLLPSLRQRTLPGPRDLPQALSLLHIQLSNQPVGLPSHQMAMQQLLVVPLFIPPLELLVILTVEDFLGLEPLRLSVTLGSRAPLEARAILNSSATFW